MVIGLDTFKEYFKEHTQNYVIIGGTACDIHISNAGFTPRATNDIDIILIVEALNEAFVKQFWTFIQKGNYRIQEKSSGDRNYYRFMAPQNPDFPKQIELFSRLPDAINYEGAGYLTPIPVDADLSSLSAILMDQEYYGFTIEQSNADDDLHQANPEALICLKARAFLDLKARKEAGGKVDDRHIKKHKLDIFRLALLLTPAGKCILPDGIKADLTQFVEIIKDELPDQNMFKSMGVTGVKANDLLNLMRSNFDLP